MNTSTFRTEIKSQSFDFHIHYQSDIMFVGSCFTENIGNILKQLKFKININPFGIIYNPVSLAQSLDFIADKKEYADDDLFFFNEYWHSFSHHGKFSDTDKQKVLNNINHSITEAHRIIYNSEFLFITLGTAWVYEFIKSKEIVANCHKIPGKEFTERLLTENEIVKSFNALIKKIRLKNNNLKIIFSVSPVRHLKDGFSENFLSKSILRIAVNNICKQNSGVYYFPAYEILIDDLRDYRFYDSDLVHPNNTAVEYIFNFFEQTFFDDETIKISENVQRINQMKSHRIFNSQTEQSKKFIIAALNEIKFLEKKYSFLNFESEKTYFLGL
ncbi:MAG: GSCFA domain-containing protein [Bacteroidales bacterium]|nr:GSCFA domain-containing protein [Bacteroidales bacterium]